MEPYQERMITEKKELDEKIEKLKTFIVSNPIFKTLSATEIVFLGWQLRAMNDYAWVLSVRIDNFQ